MAGGSRTRPRRFLRAAASRSSKSEPESWSWRHAWAEPPYEGSIDGRAAAVRDRGHSRGSGATRRPLGAERATAFDTVERRLSYEPTVENRNRKRLRPNPVAPWELRIGHLRVYFDVEEEPRRLVTIEAVGIKIGNRVLIGGEEVELK